MVSEATLPWIALSLLPGLGPVLVRRLLERFEDPEAVAFRLPGAHRLERLCRYAAHSLRGSVSFFRQGGVVDLLAVIEGAARQDDLEPALRGAASVDGAVRALLLDLAAEGSTAPPDSTRQ